MRFRVSYQRPPLPILIEIDGLPIYWVQTEGPLASFVAIWEAPALKEYPAGLRRLLLRLMSEENEVYPAGKLHEQLHRLGWQAQWSAGRDTLTLSGEGLKEGLSRALDILYTAVAAPLLAGPEVGRHLTQLVQAEKRARAHPAYQGDSRLAFHLWGRTYSHTGSTPIEVLERMDTTQLRPYYERFILRGLKSLIIAAAEVPFALLRRWSCWHQRISYELPLPMQDLLIREAIPMAQAQQVSLRLAFPWVPPLHPQYAFYRLALMRLGGYFGAILMQSVREEGGLTYGIYAHPERCLAGSYFVISAEVATPRAEEAVSRIYKAVESWHLNPFPTEDVLLEVRNLLLLQSMPETIQEWVSRLTRAIGANVPIEFVVHQDQEIAAIERREDWPEIVLPHSPVVEVAIGTAEPIFAASCG
ncbi:MAG: insulinase family protein [Bacteroidia bacterium]|nr:insulinase family protein [Bacteroidia bacterium]